MKKNILIASVLLSLFSFGFKLPPYKGPTTFDYKTINIFKSSIEEGIITSFVGDSSMRGTIKQSSYWLLEREIFKGKYFVGNYYKEDMEFVLFCLLDYQVIDFECNKTMGRNHRLLVRKGEEIIVPIKLGHIPKGAHDLIIVAAKMAEINKNLKTVENIQSHRANIFVESTTFPKISVTSFTEKKSNSKYSSFSHRLNRMMVKKKKMNLQITNATEIKMFSTALMMNNFHDIKIDPLFFEINPKREINIPIETKYIDNRLFCLIVNNPYIMLEPKPSILSLKDTSVELSKPILF